MARIEHLTHQGTHTEMTKGGAKKRSHERELAPGEPCPLCEFKAPVAEIATTEEE